MKKLIKVILVVGVIFLLSEGLGYMLDSTMRQQDKIKESHQNYLQELAK